MGTEGSYSVGIKGSYSGVQRVFPGVQRVLIQRVQEGSYSGSTEGSYVRGRMQKSGERFRKYWGLEGSHFEGDPEGSCLGEERINSEGPMGKN